ncbi:MAG: sulfite oxidase-like oxidoreductase [Myxococcales bacterium]|nr:MAG: sulfite oxidase-like oxidoreductase [Myxococcales bacterium]
MSKLDRLIEARLALKARFEAEMSKTPSLADERPQGTGPLNRHGMPKLPIGQVASKKWPVLDLGVHPEVPLAKWRLVIDGACRSPLSLSYEDFLAMPQTEDTSDFHCVTTWSRMDLRWKGVRFADLAATAGVDEAATHVMCHGYDGYSTNLPLVEAVKPDVLLVHTVDGQPLPREHGGPVRMITPQLYAWKGSKWINRIELMVGDRPGFWEQRGYSDTGYPWRNDRYG